MVKKHSSSALRKMSSKRRSKLLKARARSRDPAVRKRAASKRRAATRAKPCTGGRVRSQKTGRCRSPDVQRRSRRRSSLRRKGLYKRRSSIRKLSAVERIARSRALARRRYRQKKAQLGLVVRSRPRARKNL